MHKQGTKVAAPMPKSEIYHNHKNNIIFSKLILNSYSNEKAAQKVKAEDYS